MSGERTTDQAIEQLRDAVKRWRESSDEPVALMVASDNFLAKMGIGSLEGADVIVHDGCTIVSIDNSAPDVPIEGSRVWVSSLSAIRETAGLDYDEYDWSYLDDQDEDEAGVS